MLEEREGVFVDRGCLFVSTTGLLLSGYVNCEVLFPYHQVIRDLTWQLILPFMDQRPEGFLCPATGDIVLLQNATMLAHDHALQTTAVWADKQDDGEYRVSRNGYEKAIRGKRVVVLNDRISQGGTTRKIVAEAHRLDCEVLGVATLAGVTKATPESLGVPAVNALCTIDVESFPADEIPEQFRGQPIVVDESLGHGAEWRVEHPDYEGGWKELLAA